MKILTDVGTEKTLTRLVLEIPISLTGITDRGIGHTYFGSGNTIGNT